HRELASRRGAADAVAVAASYHHVAEAPHPPEPYVAHPYTLLSPRGLVGRRTELHRLSDWVARTGDLAGVRVLALLGIGGEGKSALAWKFFHDVLPHEWSPSAPLAGRLWWSFYESEATFDQLITRALAYVSRRSHAEVRGLTLAQREEELLSHLAQRP